MRRSERTQGLAALSSHGRNGGLPPSARQVVCAARLWGSRLLSVASRVAVAVHITITRLPPWSRPRPYRRGRRTMATGRWSVFAFSASWSEFGLCSKSRDGNVRPRRRQFCRGTPRPATPTWAPPPTADLTAPAQPPDNNTERDARPRRRSATELLGAAAEKPGIGTTSPEHPRAARRPAKAMPEHRTSIITVLATRASPARAQAAIPGTPMDGQPAHFNPG